MSRADVVWGFYPGEYEEVGCDFGDSNVFCDERLIGVGWPGTGNLKTFAVEQRPLSDFVARIRDTYQYLDGIAAREPQAREQWFRRSAGTLHRFLCEAQAGDLVVYACKPRK